MKNVVKALVFILIFFLILRVCSDVFVLKGNTYGSDVKSFYQLDKNSLDIMFFGSSHSYASFSPDVIEEKTGMKSYNFATQRQPVYITYYYMVEALKTQKPKYFVFETKMFSEDKDYWEEGVTRDALDKMRFSWNKFEAINTSVEDRKERLSYYFNIMKYHSRYEDITRDEVVSALKNECVQNRGFKALPVNSDVVVDNDRLLDITEKQSLSEKNLLYLKKIIDLANENGITLIFAKAPSQLKDDEVRKYNALKEIVRDNGLDFIDYNVMFDELDLVIGEDFYDDGHVSYKGAEKVSNSFAGYLLDRN